MAKKVEVPIFFDPTGRRWIIARLLLVTLGCAVVAAIVYLLPLVLQGYNLGAPQPARSGGITDFGIMSHKVTDADLLRITDRMSNQNVPLLGAGPLVRVVELEITNNGVVAKDPFTKKQVRQLTSSEIDIVQDHPYVIERYGASATKRLALTFDDGPDPKYSAPILDILHREGAQSTFFVTGANVIKYPDIARRMVKEGHVIANHSFSHPHFEYINEFRSFQEINQTNRAIRTVTGSDTPFFRPPYIGSTNQEFRNNVKSILEGQRQGYVMTSYQFDPQDWNIKDGKLPSLPTFDGNDVVVLLHDSGGDRTRTIEYLQKVITAAKAHDYTFANMDQLYSQTGLQSQKVTPTIGDKASYVFFSAVLVWPHMLVKALFTVTAFLITFSLCLNITLATLQRRRSHYKRRANNYTPLTSVIVPAYNEAEVLPKTVKSILRSYYKNIEVIIVDDGSKDDTHTVAKVLSKSSPRVVCMTKRNGGKSSAINKAIRRAKGEILICVDADTVFPPSTIGRLVRHFKNPEVGAVAGAVKVGNVKNLLTRWQALEYTISVYLDRNAQAYMNSIMIVPGACGAWRKKAVRAVRGYSSMTFAEDCDLTLAVHKTGYKVLQDSSAFAYTEAPQNIGALAKQRFRWMFGNLQALWKHRNVLFRLRYGWLGMFVMPYALVTLILSVLFIPLLIVLAAHNIASGNYVTLFLFAAVTLGLQFMIALIALCLARERLSLILAFPLTRFVYGPIKTFLLFRTVFVIIRGATIAWNKLQRTNSVELDGRRV
jgi:cellulose synthase/poly-beta-1,6-N-acetylglucosamine synthase-like glycosyltransferase/peptidoglycan/xylan/chitin deacetylase (PgdA/CDA1 family)